MSQPKFSIGTEICYRKSVIGTVLGHSYAQLGQSSMSLLYTIQINGEVIQNVSQKHLTKAFEFNDLNPEVCMEDAVFVNDFRIACKHVLEGYYKKFPKLLDAVNEIKAEHFKGLKEAETAEALV